MDERLNFLYPKAELIYYLEIADIKPISLNHMYPTNFKTGRRYISPEGETYKQHIAILLASDINKRRLNHLFDIKDPLALYIDFLGADLFYKNGKLKKQDVSNFIKPVEDAISKFFNFDDSQNFEVHVRKISSSSFKIKIALFKLFEIF